MVHRTELTVAWGDTDAGGLIYYPRFFHYVILALNNYFAPAFDGAHPMESLRHDGLVLPAVDASATFAAPLRAGDAVAVDSAVTAIGDASLTLAFRVVVPEQDVRAAAGEVTFVLVDEDWDSTPLPDEMRACVTERGDPSDLPPGS